MSLSVLLPHVPDCLAHGLSSCWKPGAKHICSLLWWLQKLWGSRTGPSKQLPVTGSGAPCPAPFVNPSAWLVRNPACPGTRVLTWDQKCNQNGKNLGIWPIPRNRSLFSLYLLCWNLTGCLSNFWMRIKLQLRILKSWNKFISYVPAETLLPLSYTSPRYQVCETSANFSYCIIWNIHTSFAADVNGCTSSSAPGSFLCSSEISFSFHKIHESCRCCDPANKQQHSLAFRFRAKFAF